MSEPVNCVFIPPKFHVSDLISIVCVYEEIPETLPSLVLVVDEQPFPLKDLEESNETVMWSIDAVGDFQDIAPDATSFKLKVNEETIPFDLNDLAFMGPTKVASPPKGIFCVECVSGIYARGCDYTGETVTFNVDTIPTLDYRNVLSLRQQLEELAAAQKAFDERKKNLQDSGIDLNRLANLKSQYEECMRKKRRVQHDFMKQNQKMQAAMIKTQSEQDYQSALDSLRRHIESNKQKPAAPEKISYDRLQDFRNIALDELKQIFPYDKDNKELCGVHYYKNPNSSQWPETKAFLGFATHYIREVSRVVGIPLHYLLIPLASSSRITCRYTEEKVQIPAEYKSDSVESYEEKLIACCQHIGKTLLMQTDEVSGLTGNLELLNSITIQNLKTLIPKTDDAVRTKSQAVLPPEPK